MRSGASKPKGGAAPSMFGLRWINPISTSWHSRPSCPALQASHTRAGWRSFPITLGYGRDFYKPCGRCTRAL